MAISISILLLPALILVAVAMLLLSVRVLLKRGGRFPNTHIGGSKAMRDRGIGCQKTQQMEADLHRNLKERVQANQ